MPSSATVVLRLVILPSLSWSTEDGLRVCAEADIAPECCLVTVTAGEEGEGQTIETESTCPIEEMQAPPEAETSTPTES